MSTDWSFNYCKRTGLARNDGLRQYRAKFSRIPDERSFEWCWVRFWAKRPSDALRRIASSGHAPTDFDGFSFFSLS